MAQIDVKAPIHTLLTQLNTIRIAKSLPLLKTWRKSRADLVAAIARTGVTVTRIPPAVAEGAYKDNRAAQAKTSHTTNGKTKSQHKREAIMAKEVAKRIDVSISKMNKLDAPTKALVKKMAKELDADTKKGTQKRASVPAGAFSLADWARTQKLSPKIARARARKHTPELKKLQISKYVYPNKARAGVNKILGGK